VKVILTENLPALGTAGAVVEVTRGYARNFLIPQGKALEATAGNLARFKSQQARFVEQAAKEKDTALELAARLAEVSLTIPQRVGESERLYGSVTNVVIAQALEDKGFAVDRRQLELDEPIKRLGSYLVSVRLAPEVKVQVRVEVVPETA
jgi:large subunit ribosomal protein L9